MPRARWAGAVLVATDFTVIVRLPQSTHSTHSPPHRICGQHRGKVARAHFVRTLTRNATLVSGRNTRKSFALPQALQLPLASTQASSQVLRKEQWLACRSTKGNHSHVVSAQQPWKQKGKTRHGVSQLVVGGKGYVSRIRTSSLKVSSGAPQTPAIGASEGVLNHAPHMALASVSAFAALKVAHKEDGQDGDAVCVTVCAGSCGQQVANKVGCCCLIVTTPTRLCDAAGTSPGGGCSCAVPVTSSAFGSTPTTAKLTVAADA